MDLINTLALLPERASNLAEMGDGLHHFIYGLSAFFFVLIITLMGFFAWKYRRRDMNEPVPRDQTTHSNVLEIAWSLPPLIIVLGIFWVGMKDYIAMANPSADPMVIDVHAWKWNWEFTHPYLEYADSELLIPVNTPIEVVTRSDDVIHSFYVPAFRVKKDAVPGRYNRAYFTATRPGEYPVFCAEYCGTQHSTMLSKVIVLPSYEAWKEEIEKRANLPFRDLPDELFEQWKSIENADDFDAFKAKVKRLGGEWAQKADALKPASFEGEALAKKKGCATCHSVDGTRLSGPTWKGLLGATRTFTDGAGVVADENYIRESILYPNKHVVATYTPGQMPQFQGTLSDRDIDALIAYIRTLAD